MGLRVWTTETGGTSGDSNIKGGFRWKVINSDTDRETYNRSVLRVEGMGYRDGGSYPFNLSEQTSYYTVAGSTQSYTSQVDFRSASSGTYYYVDTNTSIFPKGTYKDYTIYHNTDGTKSVSVKAFINFGGTSASPGMSLTKTITLPAIDVHDNPTKNGYTITELNSSIS